MSAALIKKIRDAKNTECEHLYLDGDECVRDIFIENMFKTCFHGEPIDDSFKINFRLYFEMLMPDNLPFPEIPEQVFSDDIVAAGWLISNFGLAHITTADPDDTASDPDLAHCEYVTVLRTRFAKDIDAAYAPTRLHSILLAAIIVFRAVAQRWYELRFGE